MSKRQNCRFTVQHGGLQNHFSGLSSSLCCSKTSRHLTTRLTDQNHYLRQHVSECCMDKVTLSGRIVNKFSQSVEKLLTLEGLHISRRKPASNQRKGYRQRELTLMLRLLSLSVVNSSTDISSLCPFIYLFVLSVLLSLFYTSV